MAVWKMRSWKVSSWKARHEIGKNEVGKCALKLENTTEVEKWLMELESVDPTWKESTKLEMSTEIVKLNWY